MTLLHLVGEANEVFDGSTNGVAILKSTNARVLPRDGGIALDSGPIEVGRQGDLDGLQSFTIDAEIAPVGVSAPRQNIIEGQTPAFGGSCAGRISAPWLRRTSFRPAGETASPNGSTL